MSSIRFSSPRLCSSRSWSSDTRRRSERANSRPITDAVWTVRFSGSASRSRRAAMTSWTVSGTVIVEAAFASTRCPSSVRTAPVSTSVRPISSRKKGLPSAFAAIVTASSRGRSATPSAALHGIQRRHALIAGIDREQIAQERLDARRVVAEELEAAVDLRDDLLLGVPVFDAEVPLQHLDNRQEGNRLAERDAVALDPGRRVPESLAELEQKPRLADARVADHEDGLAPTAPGLRPGALERRERVVAPHER